MGNIATRTRSKSNGVVLEEKVIAPTRNKCVRVPVKTQPLTAGVVVKVEPQDCTSNVQNVDIVLNPVNAKVESASASSTSSTSNTSTPVIVPKVECPPLSSSSSSRSSSPIFLKAERPASPALSTISLHSTSSQSSISLVCSSFHLPSSLPPLPYNTTSYWDVRRGNSITVNSAPSGSKVKVWDVQNGQQVIRELPLVAPEQARHEQRESVSTNYQERPRTYYKKTYYRRSYYKKPYYKKPYLPYWKRNNRGGGRRGRQCRCDGTCYNCGYYK